MLMQNVSLQEQLLLLHLNDETGKFEGWYLSYGLNAAALAELLLNNRIVLDADRVKVQSAEPVGDELLDVALARLAMSTRTYKLGGWVRSLYRDKKMPIEVLTARLVRRGILTIEKGRVLWIFPRTVYPTTDPTLEQQVRHQIHSTVLSEKSVDERIAILISLLHGCQALGFVLNKAELRKFKKRIQNVFESDPIGYAVGKAVASVIAEDAAAAAAAVAASS